MIRMQRLTSSGQCICWQKVARRGEGVRDVVHCEIALLPVVGSGLVGVLREEHGAKVLPVVVPDPYTALLPDGTPASLRLLTLPHLLRGAGFNVRLHAHVDGVLFRLYTKEIYH